MKWKALTLAAIVAATGAGASSCSTPSMSGQGCSNGEGTWIEDESDWLTDGHTVIVRICVSENGQVLDMEVD